MTSAVVSSAGRGSALVRGDALRLPLADNSVDLVVTSPPYFSLRSYQDGGEHYDNQIGSENSPQAFLEALWAVTAECARVLKPSGSMFINLGDKYAGSGGHNNSNIKPRNLPGQSAKAADRARYLPTSSRNAPDRYNQNSGGIPAKSRMLLPERFRIGCVDRLGLICRAVIIWNKPNGLPESVVDRVRSSHEDWVHLTKRGSYFSAVDEIRESYSERVQERQQYAGRDVASSSPYAPGDRNDGGNAAGILGFGHKGANPLGKLPGSVWTIPTEPLRVPDWLDVDHFAAFPSEWPRRLILGWSPSGVCTVCGEGRRPVVEKTLAHVNNTDHTKMKAIGRMRSSNPTVARESATITGEACACPSPDAPTRPAVVLDPFVGTGTTVGVARSLGRFGVGVDLSADYLRLARWRVWQSGHFGKAITRTWKERQATLFDGEDAA